MVKKNYNKSLISVIINCHNGEKYLHTAIKSVISQTYTNWEIVFWDNKSTDRSASIIKNFKDKRIKYFYAKKFTNLHKARNYAIKKSKGTFISFLDADDYWADNKLSLQIKKFKDKNVNLVYGNYWMFNENYIFKKKIYFNFTLPSGYILNELLKKYIISLPTIIIRKSTLKNLKYIFDSSFKIIGDFDLCIRLSEKNKFECVQEPIAYNRIHDDSLSIKNRSVLTKELSNWIKLAKKGKYGKNIAINKNLKFVQDKIDFLKRIDNINKNKNIFQLTSFLIKNFNSYNLKIFTKALTPKYILKKLTIFG